ncbi:MAG: cytochrome c maturation protein CcmE [Dehalococcoidales bacterium]|nr:cytochrome c maturation protein CcmE [Dehalococcoidales bacterium]
MKRLKFIIGAVIVLVAVGFLGYQGFMYSATYYYTVSEFAAQQSNFADKNVRVTGNVTAGTIERQGSTLKFTMTDGQNNLQVVYQGVVPDSFKAGIVAVVQGKLNPTGIFEATQLLARCPSKYEPVDDQPK